MKIDEALEVYKHPTQHFSSEHREADKIAIQSMKELKLLRSEIKLLRSETCRNKMFRLGYNKAIDDFQEWLKTQIVGVDNTTNEILVVVDDMWVLAIDKFKESF